MTLANVKNVLFSEKYAGHLAAKTATSQIHLPSESVLVIPCNGSVFVGVHAGTVWLTVDNDERDHLVHAGESVQIKARGRALVQAISGSAVLTANSTKVKKMMARKVLFKFISVLLPFALTLETHHGALAANKNGGNSTVESKSTISPRGLMIREESLALLRDLVSINSGTSHVAGQDAMRRILVPAFQSLGFVAQEHPGLGGRKVISFEATGAKPRVLLVGHIDTVFNLPSTGGRLVIEGDKLSGPGVIDMKGGIVLMLEILRDLKIAGRDDILRSIRVVLNDDEETGSMASRETLKTLAIGCDAALIFEPGLPNGALVTAHAGVRWLKMTVHGKAAHAGLEPKKGLNACVELGHKLVELGSLSDFNRHLTVNPGVIEGGNAPNVVCENASVKIDVRYTQPDDLQSVLAKIERIKSRGHVVNDLLNLTTSAEIAELASMPPMPAEATRQLYEMALNSAASLGQKIDGEPVGYASDGNTLSGTGMALLVGLGPYGGGMHTDGEFMLAHSFAERAALSKALIIKILQTPPNACFRDNKFQISEACRGQ